MNLYGLYIHDLAAGDLVWFTTEKSLTPGAYLLDRGHGRSPNVYVAESIPALVLQVGPLLDQAESRAQSSLSPGDIPSGTEQRLATEMTGGLLQRLTETSSIWVPNPDWVDELHPVTGAEG